MGAKNTVLMNYLPDAAQHGADIFTQVEVQHVSPSTTPGQWDVHCILVGATNPSNPSLSFIVTTKLLVLAAGKKEDGCVVLCVVCGVLF